MNGFIVTGFRCGPWTATTYNESGVENLNQRGSLEGYASGHSTLGDAAIVTALKV